MKCFLKIKWTDVYRIENRKKPSIFHNTFREIFFIGKRKLQWTENLKYHFKQLLHYKYTEFFLLKCQKARNNILTDPKSKKRTLHPTNQVTFSIRTETWAPGCRTAEIITENRKKNNNKQKDLFICKDFKIALAKWWYFKRLTFCQRMQVNYCWA